MFKKYPRIPHVPGSKSTDDDIVLGAFPQGIFEVYEKFDGASLGVSLVDGQLRLQNRGGYLEFKRPHEQWDAAKDYVLRQRYLDFMEFLKALPGATLFGEWLYARHSIRYVNLPDYFIAYDVWHEGRFMSEGATVAKEFGFSVPQLIDTTDEIPVYLEGVNKLNPYMEGLIFRNYPHIYKYVFPAFTAGIEGHWFNRDVERNQLRER